MKFNSKHTDNQDIIKVLKANHENLIAQIIVEALNDSEEENYLESDGGKFWMDVADIADRRVKNALVATNGEIRNRRFIPESLVPEAGNIANAHEDASEDDSLNVEPTFADLMEIENDPIILEEDE